MKMINMVSMAHLVVLGFSMLAAMSVVGATAKHTFEFKGKDFMLDGKPYQIISGEIHFDRIPREYWRQRVQLAKAMGCNTIATYVFWNNHEREKGVYDFTTENRNLVDFIKIVQDEGLWMLFRPGPYCCGEWDLGGIPPYLLSDPKNRIRTIKSKPYMEAVENYLRYLSKMIEPYLVSNGGPILMVQIENEYGSYSNERDYMEKILEIWKSTGIKTHYYTSDGATVKMLKNGNLPGCAVGLDPAASQKQFDLAYKMNPGVPVFTSELYPGWITHWGDKRFASQNAVGHVRWLMDHKLSFNLYVLNGGSNFGFTAGANNAGAGFRADITSYDYGSPISESGLPTEQYMQLKRLLAKYPSGKNAKLPLPRLPLLMEVPRFDMQPLTTIWNNLGNPVETEMPEAMETLKQYHGWAVYQTEIDGGTNRTLRCDRVHDMANVFVDDKFIGTLDRKTTTIKLPQIPNGKHKLELLVMAFGHTNFGEGIQERKGLCAPVKLSGKILKGWKTYRFPMQSDWVTALKPGKIEDGRRGVFFKGSFKADDLKDTYIDMTNYTLGMVWVNGHNLGRYWNIGPQHTLYCPAPFLKKGENTVIVFDMMQAEAKPLQGVKTLR